MDEPVGPPVPSGCRPLLLWLDHDLRRALDRRARELGMVRNDLALDLLRAGVQRPSQYTRQRARLRLLPSPTLTNTTPATPGKDEAGVRGTGGPSTQS